MPNYLQRVATAGARTGSPVRPSATALPLVPDGMIPPPVSWSGPAAEETNATPEQGLASMMPPAPPQPGSKIATPPIAEAAIVSPEPVTRANEQQAHPAALLPHFPNVNRSVIEAPKGLRREPQPPAPGSPTGTTPLPGKAQDLTSEREHPVERPSTSPMGKIPATPLQTMPAPDQHAEPKPRSIIEQPASKIIVQSPASSRPEQKLQENVPAAPVTPAASISSQLSIPALPQTSTLPPEVRPGNNVTQSPARSRGVPITPRADDLSGAEPRVQPAAIWSSDPAVSPALTEEERITARTMAATATVMALPASPSSSQNRINIGRIEVQVNNQTPQIRRIELRPATPGHVGFLQTHYLNRFAMKP